MKKNFSAKKHGFTLIELMTATAIMVVLVMFITNIAVDMLKAYDKTTNALSVNSDSRNILDPLEEDLTTGKMFEDNHTWFEVRFDDDVGNIEAASAPKIMLFAQSRDRIRRKMSRGATPEIVPGDLCAVAYRILHQAPFGKATDSPENMVYAVYRSVLNPEDTLKLALPYILGSAGKSQNETEMTPNKFWTSSEQITDPATEDKFTPANWQKDIQNYLADGIVNLSFIFWYDEYEDTQVRRKIAVVNNPYLTSYVRQKYPAYDVTTFSRSIAAKADAIIFDDNFTGKKSGSLRAVDVSLTVLNPQGKSRLMALQRQAGEKIPEDKFTELVTEFGETFTRSFSLFDSSNVNAQARGNGQR